MHQNQSNALRRLEVILDEAVTHGKGNEPAGSVLLKVMKLGEKPQNLVDFYELLNKADEEAKRLTNEPKIDRYFKTLTELRSLFIVNHPWTTQWNDFASQIENRNIILVLHSLAKDFYERTATTPLEQDFLEKLKDEFESLLDKVLHSDLSKELKRLLTNKLEDILHAIRRYYIDGTEGVEKALQSLTSDLVITECKIKDEDKKNPLYRSVVSCVSALLVTIAPTSIYDIIGAVPDIEENWIPKFEALREEIEQSICTPPTIQEAFEKATSLSAKQTQKSIMGGKELLALPASEENTTPDDSQP